MAKLRITQVRSTNGCPRRARDTVRSLGLGRVGSSREHEDRPQLRGMLRSVEHLVSVEEA